MHGLTQAEVPEPAPAQVPKGPRIRGSHAGTNLSSCLAAASLFITRPAARAEDSVAYKYEDYREADGRISVVTQGASVDEDVLFGGHIALSGSIDAVAGATPTGRPAPPGSDQVPLTEIHTYRKAWKGSYSEQFNRINIDASFAESRESDYVSWAWSVNTLTDFNEKNTTLRAGISGGDDRVEVIFEPTYLPKHTVDSIVGITQLLNPTTFFSLNFSAGKSTGYLSEPYKTVEKAIEIVPNVYLDEAFGENSPNVRDRYSLYASINRSFRRLRGAVEASYRFYWDSFGVVAHTLQLSWLQHVGSRLVLEPSLRFYTQTAARFYYYDLDDTPIIPVRLPMGTAPYYTSDFRLSAEDSAGYRLKATWKATEWMRLDGSFGLYLLHGRDGITPESAYPRATLSTVGIRFLW